jgi:hypothetical protein
MTRIVRNTKEYFEIEQRVSQFATPDRLECQLENDDDTQRLFVNGVELTAQQCAKLQRWLDRAHRVMC